ncbi:pentapeptide repeat-containing protein [Streptomyces sp. NPDC058695]|uniref:pentapeptide repeat-containing protein n=1 Tax=Streptomyces sp. NPDC058695 TaxID=3346604 RepID=UPI003648C589
MERIVTVLTALATLAVTSFTWVSITQVRDDQSITREGQITDRFNAAVANVGSKSLDVRLGGIYALQRIMQDSERDQPTVINILSAYVRAHASRSKSTQEAPPSDVAAALSVLAFRNEGHDGSARVNLRSTYLRGATLFNLTLDHKDEAQIFLHGGNFEGADLDEADLTKARLPGTNLNRASLSGTELGYASMPGVKLRGASMSGTVLKGADLNHADLTNAYLRNADLTGANLTGANLTGADLTGAILTGAKVEDVTR